MHLVKYRSYISGIRRECIVSSSEQNVHGVKNLMKKMHHGIVLIRWTSSLKMTPFPNEIFQFNLFVRANIILYLISLCVCLTLTLTLYGFSTQSMMGKKTNKKKINFLALRNAPFAICWVRIALIRWTFTFSPCSTFNKSKFAHSTRTRIRTLAQQKCERRWFFCLCLNFNAIWMFSGNWHFDLFLSSIKFVCVFFIHLLLLFCSHHLPGIKSFYVI